MRKLKIACAICALCSTLQATAQMGSRLPSERKVITDPQTGVELVFLTSKSGTADSKIYQTHNQWTADGKWIVFRSDRIKGEALAVNEATGDIVQVTEGGYEGMLCVARKSMKLYHMRRLADKKTNFQGMAVVEVDLQRLFDDSESGKLKPKKHYERICGVIPPEMCSEGDMALDGSEQLVYFRLDKEYARKLHIAEPIAKNFGPRNMGAGPGGIGKMDLLSGKAEPVVAVHFKVGHIQGNPWHPGEVIFCWETGGKAPQRTWIANADGTNLRPIYRETESDWVTHEAVISEDEVALAIIGHRPIQTNVKKNIDGLEAFAMSNDWGPAGTKEHPTGIAVVNLRTRELSLEGPSPANDNYWHVAGSQDRHWLAGDNFARELWLIDRHTKEQILLTAGHKTTARDHVHPTFKPDGTEIEIQSAMLSDDGRSMNICIVKLPQHLIDRYHSGNATSQAANDNNTPLHLMKPAYRLPYGIPTASDVEAVISRVRNYVDQQTPAVIVDKQTGQRLARPKDIDQNAQLKQGGFRLTSYEWGVTYSAMLAAYKATGDTAYLNYVTKRHQLLADAAPYFKRLHQQGKPIDPNIRHVIDPHALDDAGAMCCSMIKALINDPSQPLRPLIDNYVDYILNKEYRLPDGTFARLRPQKNSLWLDDMFMGIPAIAYMGRLTGDSRYYDEAARQVTLFASHMWMPEKKLFRHGWFELPTSDHNPQATNLPAFHWGRANGWAFLTLCEVLDVLPSDHPKRPEILNLLRAHAEGLASLQHHDGFWHQLLDRNDTYLETSATAIYAYCMAHAINQGWIPAKAFGPVALLAWQAVASSVNERGQVEGVCVGTGMGFDASFYAYRPVHPMAAHGYGPTIWAGAEIIRLLQLQHPKLNDSAVQFYDDNVPTDQPIFNYDGKIRY